jgi:hypothetical protein
MAGKVRIKVKVCPYGEPYKRIVHEHLRYAGKIDISEFPPEPEKPIEFVLTIENRTWAEMVVARIKSFGDYAEILK